jgi:peptide/nickel transport system permease protein
MKTTTVDSSVFGSIRPRDSFFVHARKVLTSHPSAMIGMVIFVVLLILAIIGPLIAPYDPLSQTLADQLQAPSWHHLFGTDQFGRDIFSRILAGARLALLIGVVADVLALAFGTLFGLFAAFYGGFADTAIMRTMDVLLAFPYLLLAMLVIALLGPGLYQAVAAIGIVYIPQFARIVRSAALAVRQEPYIEVARSIGASPVRIIFRHVLINSAPPIIAQTTLMFGISILEVAGLGFLGLGAQPPQPEWGAMLAEGRSYILTSWWMATVPGLAIMFSVLGFNLLGDVVFDILDPNRQQSVK